MTTLRGSEYRVHEAAERWRAGGERRQIFQPFGPRLFVRVERPASGTRGLPLLILHGFPTSSFDFRATLPALAACRLVVLHDHVGFGLSDKPRDFSYSLIEQADAALALWRSLGIARAHLLAHDYGTSVATEILARRERGEDAIDLASLVLCNGSVHQELARPALSQRVLRGPAGPLLARLANQRFFVRQLRRIFGRPDAVEEGELVAAWDLCRHDGGTELVPRIAGYMAERIRFRRRWVGALERLALPTLVLWGDRDPIALPTIARALAAEIDGARLEWLAGLGHYPMLEDPPRWAAAVDRFLLEVESRAAQA